MPRTDKLDTFFARRLLSQVVVDVKEQFPHFNLRKCVSVVGGPRDFFVQIHPENGTHFDWQGRASSNTEARFKAWCAYLDKYGKAHDKEAYDEEA
jgi:hypothetical protein